jgi:VWFA-related protein
MAFMARLHIVVTVLVLCAVMLAQQEKGHEAATVFITAERQANSNLSVSDLLCVVDGISPQPPNRIASASTTPLRLVIAIDASSSVSKSPTYRPSIAAAVDLVRELQGTGIAVDAAVVSFNENLVVVQDFTTDADRIAAAASKIAAGRGTRLNDAVVEISNRMLQGYANSDSRRAILLITDGEENVSRMNAEEAVRVAQENGVAVYVIGVELANGARRPEKARMKMFASESGALSFFPADTAALPDIAHTIAADFRNQYMLSLTLPNDGKLHSFKVKPVNRSALFRAPHKVSGAAP